MLRRLALIVPVFLVAGLLAAISASPAGAETPSGTTFALTTLHAYEKTVVADGRVFILGSATDPIQVRAADGSPVGTIDESGASDITASPDGTTLYVALNAGNAIAAVSTSTLAEVTRYATGTSTCPQTLSALGSVVWFGYGCSAGQGGIGAIDLSTSSPTVDLGIENVYFYGAPHLASSAAVPDRLFAAYYGEDPSTLQSFAVSGATLTPNASVSPGENMQDMAITADGTAIITASGFPYEHPSYSTTDLTAGLIYTTTNYPDSVATASNGLVAAGEDSPYDTDIFVFTQAGAQLHAYDFGSTSMTLAGAGLAFSADATLLYAVTQNIGVAGSFVLHVITGAAIAPSTMTLTGPATANRYQATTLTGTLTSLGQPVSGATIAVTRKTMDGTVTLTSAHTDSAGHFSVATSSNVGGSNLYTASWAGDSTQSAASKTFTVVVNRLTPTMSVATDRTAYAYEAIVHVTAHLGATYKNHTVTIYKTQYGASRVTLRTAVVDSHGDVTTSFTGWDNTVITVAYSGDEIWAPRTITAKITVAALVTTALSGSYKTSGSYRVFHTSTGATYTAGVHPNISVSGRHVWFYAQVVSDGKWVATATPLEEDTSGGIAVAVFDGRTNLHFRLRVVFYGDAGNTEYGTGWSYVEFTS